MEYVGVSFEKCLKGGYEELRVDEGLEDQGRSDADAVADDLGYPVEAVGEGGRGRVGLEDLEDGGGEDSDEGLLLEDEEIGFVGGVVGLLSVEDAHAVVVGEGFEHLHDGLVFDVFEQPC